MSSSTAFRIIPITSGTVILAMRLFAFASITIVSSGIVPPWLRWFCDDATKLFKSMCDSSFNAKIVGTLYAGAVEPRGIDRYLERAYRLGERLAR